MVAKVETAKLFDDVGYYLLRFRHSVFGYKLRPWTVYLLTMKGIEFDAYDTLTQYLTDSEKYGNGLKKCVYELQRERISAVAHLSAISLIP